MRIIGYAYQADIYCPNCILNVLNVPEQERWETVEDALDDIASDEGIDREDEWTFDSGDFPKVIYDWQSPNSYCGECLSEPV